ncbi:hypothetical protein NE237_006723 [Protea cynaroides]|uniref:Uncharacterized protein n=1 Tax=Protea cynaroides TaxID=273540 RepID=A0A9Q0KN53_9MAGN|nr:hypothetical protein NE237_006723 [Protea cynaroides]
MELIHKLLNLVLPPITVFAICLMLPFLSIFKVVNFIFRCLFSKNIKGKIVLITDSSSGIGKHLAYDYARKGANLALVDIREDKLRDVVEKAGQLGSPNVLVICADVSKVDQCKQFIDEVVDELVDHLICNAGMGINCAFEDATNVTNFVQVMDVNFSESVYPTYFAIPHLKRSRGKIFVTTSVSGWMFQPMGSIYGASKAALINFYDNMRVELTPKVSVKIISPGFVESELLKRQSFKQARRFLNLQYVLFLPKCSIGTKSCDITVEQMMQRIPFEKTKDYTKAVVAAVCRGDKYITEPWWYNSFYLLKIVCPEVIEWSSYLKFSNRPTTS